MPRVILVVDDDGTLRSVLRQALVDNGYQVLEGNNGREGIELATRYGPDLIISDIVMPEVDGWDFCQALRQESKTRATPFVFLTSLDQAPEKILGLKLGADAFLNKPFNAGELMRVVEELLGRIERREEVLRDRRAVTAESRTDNIIVDTVEFLRSTGRDGVITVESADNSGRVLLRSGRVRHASFGGLAGEGALLAMLRAEKSRVSFTDGVQELPENTEMSWQDFMASILDKG